MLPIHRTIICIIYLAISAGFFDAVKDTLAHHYSSSIFAQSRNKEFFDPNISWKNKYKEGNPQMGEAFLFSTTYLVTLTDAWHLAKTAHRFHYFVLLFFFGLFCYDIKERVPCNFNQVLFLLATMAIYICYAVSFHVFYTYLLIY